MIPNSFEAVFLILIFLLPGYTYKTVKSRFKYTGWEKPEIEFLGFIFNSFLFQILTWFILTKIFNIEVIGSEVLDESSLSHYYATNSVELTYQIVGSVGISVLAAITTSLKPFQKLILRLQAAFGIKKYLDFGLSYGPPINATFDGKTDFGNRFVGAVVELESEELYDGNIKHIAWGKNPEDYFIVLSQVKVLKKGRKQIYPEEIEVLLPYSKIKTITYKTYPTQHKEQSNQSGFSEVTLFLLASSSLLLLLWVYQSLTSNYTFIIKTIELLATLIVTFLGVFGSFYLTKRFENHRDAIQSNSVLESALILLWSELDLSETTFITLTDAYKNMPRNPARYYDQYTFLIEMAKGSKTKVFYNITSTQAISELAKNKSIFNAVQQAYYNIELAINGLNLSKELFIELRNIKPIPPDLIESSNNIYEKELNKLEQTLTLIVKAKMFIYEELELRGLQFSRDDGSFNL